MEPIALNHLVVKFLQPKIITCALELGSCGALELLKHSSYLAILNQYGHPQGLFTPECAKECQAGLSLADINLEPLPAIADQTTIKEFLDRLYQYDHFASIWAVVDRYNQYLGVVEVLPLIRRMALELNNQSLRQFINLIEQLPFPVLVCELDYKVVGVNDLWQQEFGEYSPWQGDRLIRTVKPNSRTWQIDPAHLNGDLAGLIMAIAQDVTAQEHLTQELSAQNADLVRLNRIKDEFIACISHELKTPLTSVIGMASLLGTESIGNLNERQKRYVNIIHQNGRHLTFMIDNFMDLAKAEAGQLGLHFDVMSVEDICQKSIQKIQKLSQDSANLAQPLNIGLHIDPRVENIIADMTRVQQMLVNLISNALKFSEDIPKVSLSVQMWEGWIALSVSDRGIGIPKDKQHLIFQKFQQLENTFTRKHDGVGLGLVLTRHLARLHGGDVTFISQVGKGSEFTILLPTSPLNLLEPRQIRASSQLVLVVENIPEDIDHLITILGDLNYRVVVARSGTEALEKARKLQPSLIFLNPDLPILSGWDVLSLLKKDASTAAITVLMTINDNFTNVVAEADWYLSKPIASVDLAFLRAIAPTYFAKLTIFSIGTGDRQNISLIQGLGHQVITATDISQAEVLAKLWQPQLVLLDYAMTELSVKLRRISHSANFKNLPIFLIRDLIHDLNDDQNSDRPESQELDILSQFPSLNLHFLHHSDDPREFHQSIQKVMTIS